MNEFYFICNIPYRVRSRLCDMIDASDRAEDLGEVISRSRASFFDNKTLSLLMNARLQGKSPARAILNRWGETGGTANQLFFAFYHMRYKPGMLIILPYVDAKYHKYLPSENGIWGKKSSSAIKVPTFSSGDKPSFPQLVETNESSPQKHSVHDESQLPKPSLTVCLPKSSLPAERCFSKPFVEEESQLPKPTLSNAFPPKSAVPAESCLSKPAVQDESQLPKPLLNTVFPSQAKKLPF